MFMIYRHLVTASQRGDAKLGVAELIGLRLVNRDTNNDSLRYSGSRVVLGINKADCLQDRGRTKRFLSGFVEICGSR